MTCKTASTMHYLKRQLLPVISIFALPQGNYNCLTDRVLYALVSLDLVDLHIHGTLALAIHAGRDVAVLQLTNKYYTGRGSSLSCKYVASRHNWVHQELWNTGRRWKGV
eukprot:jgi/Chrzof1/9020/Cz03g33070.t1